MYCGNDFFKIYLMVLYLIIILGQCKLEKAATVKRQKQPLSSYFTKGHKNLDKFIKILHLKRRSQELDRKLKHRLDQIILENNLQLLKDQTRAQLLKIENTCFENFSKAPRENGNDKYKTKKSSDNSDSKAKVDANISKVQKALAKTKFDARKFLRKRKYNQNSKYINHHKLWKREGLDDDSPSSNTDESDSIEDSNHRLLQEIVAQLDEIRESSLGSQPKGPCFLNGTWISDLVGLSFTITFHEDAKLLKKQKPKPKTSNCTTKPVNCCTDDGDTSSEVLTTTTTTRNPLKVDMQDACLKIDEIVAESGVKQQGIVDTTYTITARIPFARTTMLMITGLHPVTKAISIFVGQCSYCSQQELVVGQWMVQRYTQDCRRKLIHEDVFGDVLRRPKK